MCPNVPTEFQHFLRLGASLLSLLSSRFDDADLNVCVETKSLQDYTYLGRLYQLVFYRLVERAELTPVAS